MADTTIWRYTNVATWATKPPQTLVGYRWDPNLNKESGARVSLTWNRVSSANATAEWVLTGTTIPAGTYLYVSNGTYAGTIIPKAAVSIVTAGIRYSLPHSLNRYLYPPRFQFGQAGAPCSGKSCCTDTCIQMLGDYWLERTYSLKSIRNMANPNKVCQGLNPSESLKALNAMGISWYTAALNVNASFVKSKLPYGPVLVGVWYGSYPNSTTGRCGTTNQARRNGRTDCGFTGAHAVIALGSTTAGVYATMRDPDHNSAARPEKPDYDIITWAQLDKTMKDLPAKTNWSVTFCLYPLKKKVL